MKVARILLLVLLALVLPFRGALANVAHCAGGPGEFVRSVPAVHEHGGAAHVHDAHVHAQDPGHDQAGAHGDADKTPAGAAADKCNLCSASCSATPFVSAAPVIAAPLQVADAAFPALLAPPASHPSDGQERPPRSI